MFKLIRSFFIIFVAITLIPLIVMFFMHKHYMDKAMLKENVSIVHFGISQTKENLYEYKRNEKNLLVESAGNYDDEQKLINTLNSKDEIIKAEFIPKTDKNNNSYYNVRILDNITPELVIVHLLDLKNFSQTLKVTKLVDYKKITSQGPFDTIITIKNINGEKHIKRFVDKFQMHPGPPPPHINSPNHKIKRFRPPTPASKTIKLNIPNENFSVSLQIIGSRPPGPPGLQGPEERPQFGLVPLVLLASGILLSIILALIINKNFIEPFFLISKKFKTLSEGNFDTNISQISKQKEVQLTYDNFNKMVKEIKEKEELRNSFIENLTHDLKTPLIAQERALKLLAEEFKKLNQEDSYELANGLSKNNNYLLNMVNRILETYRIDNEENILKLENINLLSLIEACAEKITPILKDKNIGLTIDVTNELIVKADEVSLKRVFVNLLSNAIENNPQGSKIVISSNIKENKAVINVTDNGVGIAQEEISYIFDKYYTGKSNRRKIGSGLGLYSCKKLIEKNYGTIELESKEGNFTRFIINIPLGD